jgi:hypothetical protein
MVARRANVLCQRVSRGASLFTFRAGTREIAGKNADKNGYRVEKRVAKSLNKNGLPLEVQAHNAEVEGSSPSLTTNQIRLYETLIG